MMASYNQLPGQGCQFGILPVKFAGVLHLPKILSGCVNDFFGLLEDLARLVKDRVVFLKKIFFEDRFLDRLSGEFGRPFKRIWPVFWKKLAGSFKKLASFLEDLNGFL